MKKPKQANLIIADDDTVITGLLEIHAKKQGFQPIITHSGDEVLQLISPATEVVLLDLNMPGMSGLEVLKKLTKDHPHLPAIILTASSEASEAVTAMKLGAYDYLTKPFDPSELFAVLHKARKMRQLAEENSTLKEMINDTTPVSDIIAVSPSMQVLLDQIQKIASLEATVLLTGESGVGKTMIARQLHQLSQRNQHALVTVSCPALPRELLESELFGHEKGAFTGAMKKRIGKIEMADKGTLFLDEIGDLPLDLQPKLLNVLQDREYYRLGSERILKTDVRIIVATNLDLEEKIESGSFREDLYYRLNVFQLVVPALRERVQCIIPLCERALQKIAERRGDRAASINKEARDMLLEYHWPGNVRELENMMERASAFCQNNTISASDLVSQLKSSSAEGESNQPNLGNMKWADIEKLSLEQTLAACSGNKSKAAKVLGIAEKSVYNKMKKYAIES
ncbi:sigma-54-dependent transcriptional regulator [Persicirhabdus sediminis]|uniref:Sigma-54-dependent Fis family transcriptional regulator n=1 Tax=Persicirhabdus sediminis TaxID=454144 RepID=A0A8J7SIE9_9BACT|nr:sigma-54 dependent transcriptional regulator [Persicirhabdus sediminis]MBK1790544.1 sigma-54-dependent Fis family transcriptional regulator [Persicirhabdus sediminis]